MKEKGWRNQEKESRKMGERIGEKNKQRKREKRKRGRGMWKRGETDVENGRQMGFGWKV